MDLVWEKVTEKYTYIFDDLTSPLVKDWFLISSPLPILVILLIYNIFCCSIGPKLMTNRQPYNLETAIKLYNIFQVIISLYITYEGSIYIFSGNFNFNCHLNDNGNERVARATQVYLITKLIELLDTIFFVLRKSERQITFLHVFHHTLMPIITWMGLKYFPGGQEVIANTINSLVHVFMYSYYLLSTLGPQFRKQLWWKKYLTVMQIVQFVIVLVHSVNSLFYPCSFPIFFKFLTITIALIFINMFSKFYYYNYVKPKSNKNARNNAINEFKKTNNSTRSDGNEYFVSDDSSTVKIGNNKSNNGARYVSTSRETITSIIKSKKL